MLGALWFTTGISRKGSSRPGREDPARGFVEPDNRRNRAWSGLGRMRPSFGSANGDPA